MAKVPDSNWRIAPDRIEVEGPVSEEPSTSLPHPPIASSMPGSVSAGEGSSGALSVGTLLLVLAGIALVAFGLGKLLGLF